MKGKVSNWMFRGGGQYPSALCSHVILKRTLSHLSSENSPFSEPVSNLVNSFIWKSAPYKSIDIRALKYLYIYIYVRCGSSVETMDWHIILRGSNSGGPTRQPPHLYISFSFFICLIVYSPMSPVRSTRIIIVIVNALFVVESIMFFPQNSIREWQEIGDSL